MFLMTLTPKRERIFLDLDLYVLLFQTRQFSADDEAVSLLKRLDSRRPEGWSRPGDPKSRQSRANVRSISSLIRSKNSNGLDRKLDDGSQR
jgi:hypothetical protein